MPVTPDPTTPTTPPAERAQWADDNFELLPWQKELLKLAEDKGSFALSYNELHLRLKRSQKVWLSRQFVEAALGRGEHVHTAEPDRTICYWDPVCASCEPPASGG